MKSPYTEKTFEGVQKRLLQDRLERFSKLLELKAPSVILQNSFALVFKAFVSLYGNKSLEYIANHLIEGEKRRLGFCLTCFENPNYIGYSDSPYMMCEQCSNSVKECENETKT
jgi:hypothetical protein